MQITTVIQALRSLVTSFWPFAKTPASHVGTVGPNDPGERDGSSGDRSGDGSLDDETRTAESSNAFAETSSDPAPPKHKPPNSSSVFEDFDPGESHKTASPPTGDGQHDHPETVEEQGSAESDANAEGTTGATDSWNAVREPHKSGGRRDRQPGNPESERLQSPSSRPELVCRRDPASARWEVILSADAEVPIAAAYLKGAPLDLTDGRCSIPSLSGRLTVSSEDGQEHILPLFERDPLIFKLQKNWAGEGRRTSGITSGHFIVIAPKRWQRTGRAPVEADGCSDPEFTAHYFHRDATVSDETVGGFNEWDGSPVATGIELSGCKIHDDSDHGMLFVGDPPGLQPLREVEWARVGEEIERGWGQNFQPGKQSLADELCGREGRFFLRVYDPEVRMIDSVAFRYVRELRMITVNGTEYSQGTMLMPGETGYPRTEICLVGADGSTIAPVLPPQARHAISRSGAIEVPPHPDMDRVTCSLGTDAHKVNIVLDLPRIWWRLEDGRCDPGAWSDTPLVMTREEFRNHAHAATTLSVLSRRQSSVRAGFDERLEQPYKRTKGENRITIPLYHFADHAQIDRKLSKEANFCVEWGGEKLPLIRISADPVPEIITFTSDPPAIDAGQEVVLRWVARNAQGVRARIDPAIGFVEPTGSVRVEPAATTDFTLRLKSSDFDDVTRTVSVTVHSSRDARDLMTPMQLLEKVVEMQHGAFLEYYRGFLGADTSEEANQLRKATQYWEEAGIIELVQDRLKSEFHAHSAYFAVRTSNAISRNCIDNARVLQVHRIP